MINYSKRHKILKFLVFIIAVLCFIFCACKFLDDKRRSTITYDEKATFNTKTKSNFEILKNKIISTNLILGDINKSYYIDDSLYLSNIKIQNVNFFFPSKDGSDGKSDRRLICEGEVIFDNCTFESIQDRIPNINVKNDYNSGRGSNIYAIGLSKSANVQILNSTFTNCSIASLRGGKLIASNITGNHLDMGFYVSGYGDLNVNDSKFSMSGLPNSAYYHFLYASEVNNIEINNVIVRETERNLKHGNHIHLFKSKIKPKFLGHAKIHNLDIETNNVVGQYNSVSDVIFENSRLIALDIGKSYSNTNVFIKDCIKDFKRNKDRYSIKK